jgi:hypothetical protein
MIISVRGGNVAVSAVQVVSFPAGVRFFHLRYGGACCMEQDEMERIITSALPGSTRWHAMCLGAGDGGEVVPEDCGCNDVRGCGRGSVRSGGTYEHVWIDVVVDFGDVKSSVNEVDFCSATFRVRGRLPKVCVLSGVEGDHLSRRWASPWGGPFSRAYDREYSMLMAPTAFWCSGERLLTDFGGNGEKWCFVKNEVRKVEGAATEAGVTWEKRAVRDGTGSAEP